MRVACLSPRGAAARAARGGACPALKPPPGLCGPAEAASLLVQVTPAAVPCWPARADCQLECYSLLADTATESAVFTRAPCLQAAAA